MSRARCVLTTALISACAIFGLPAAAEPSVAVELNKLEPQGDACRAYVVLENRTDAAFDSFEMDLVLFDGDDIVARRLAIELAPLRAQKESLKVFDIQGLTCPGIGRVLVNDVVSCKDEAGARHDCLELLAPSSRAAAGFVK